MPVALDAVTARGAVLALGVLDGRELLHAVHLHGQAAFGQLQRVEDEALELVRVGRAWLDQLAGAEVDAGHLLVRAVPRQTHALAPRQTLREGHAERVHRDVGGAEGEFTRGITLLGGLLRQIAVLDHHGAQAARARTAAQHAHLLGGVALAHALAAHLAARVRGACVRAQEHRIDAAHQRVVHLEVADLLDAAALHVLQRARAVERADGAAVTVGIRGHFLRRGQQYATLGIHAGHKSLRQEEVVLRIAAEPVVVLEERARVGVVQRAGHDVPRQAHAIAALSGQQLLAEHAEEGLARDHRGGIRALGSAPAQSRALTTGHGERRHLAFTDHRLACGAEGCGVGPIVRHARHGLQRREIARGLRLGLGQHRRHVLKRQRLDLVQQRAKRAGSKRGREVQKVLLMQRGESGAGCLQPWIRGHGQWGRPFSGAAGSLQPSGRWRTMSPRRR